MRILRMMRPWKYLIGIGLLLWCVGIGCGKSKEETDQSEELLNEELLLEETPKPASSETSPFPENVVALVNAQPISREEFAMEVQTTIRQLDSPTPPDEYTLNRLREEVLMELIKRLLIAQQAKKQAVTVTGEDFQRRVQDVQNEYQGQDIQSILKAQGTSYAEWEKAQRETLLLEKLVELNMGSMITVSPEEVQQYYERNKQKYDHPVQVRASQIFTYDRDTTEKALEEVQNGADFATVAQKYSESPDAEKGGDLGFFGKEEMPPEFDEVVFALKMGEVSDIVKTPYGYHIFKLTGHREAQRVSFEDAKAQIEYLLRTQKRMFAFDLWYAELQKNSKILLNQSLIRQVK